MPNTPRDNPFTEGNPQQQAFEIIGGMINRLCDIALELQNRSPEHAIRLVVTIQTLQQAFAQFADGTNDREKKLLDLMEQDAAEATRALAQTDRAIAQSRELLEAGKHDEINKP